METMHSELKKLEKENADLKGEISEKEDRVRNYEVELRVAQQKTNKYKKIAKTFKGNLESFEQTLSKLKEN